MMVLRDVAADDSRLLWEWRNAPDVRAAAFNSEPIPWEQHEKWFAAMITDSHRLLYVAELDGEPVGQVRFDLDTDRTVADISVMLSAAVRGRGLGTELVRTGVERARSDVTELKAVRAYVRNTNEPSLRMFARAGFAALGPAADKDPEALLFVWRAGDSED